MFFYDSNRAIHHFCASTTYSNVARKTIISRASKFNLKLIFRVEIFAIQFKQNINRKHWIILYKSRKNNIDSWMRLGKWTTHISRPRTRKSPTYCTLSVFITPHLEFVKLDTTRKQLFLVLNSRPRWSTLIISVHTRAVGYVSYTSLFSGSSESPCDEKCTGNTIVTLIWTIKMKKNAFRLYLYYTGEIQLLRA